MKKYGIILTNGNIININCTVLEWDYKTNTLDIYNGKMLDEYKVAKINIDNIVGWIKPEYLVESDNKNK